MVSPEQKHSILLVDDEVSITKALTRLFRKAGYDIETAESGVLGLELLKSTDKSISLIISDQRMPEMNGSEFLEKATEIFPDAIRFLLTGYSDLDAVISAVNRGKIHRYLTKPWNDEDILLQVNQAIKQVELIRENKRLTDLTIEQNRALNEMNKGLEKIVQKRTIELVKKSKELELAYDRLKQSFLDTIRLLSSIIETINPKLGKYTKDVTQLSKNIAEEFNLESSDLDKIEMAAMIHDIGLLGLPDSLITKDEKHMDENEYRIYTQHPVIAAVSLDAIDQLKEVGEIVLYHHEQMNGKGFPNGLKGIEIPLGSRIIAVSSAYFSVLHYWPRSMKDLLDMTRRHLGTKAVKELQIRNEEEMIHEVAEKAIQMGTHSKFDPDVVHRFMKQMSQEKTIYDTAFLDYQDLEPGMTLLDDLRIRDKRLLLAKGTVLKEASVKAIRVIGDRGLIDEKINVRI